MKQTQTRAYNVRANEKPLVIEGTAVVFDKPADMGGYTEYIARNALDGVDLSNITLLSIDEMGFKHHSRKLHTQLTER